MFRIILLLMIVLVTFIRSNAQVGIGTINPHSSSILDIESTQKGFLPPRVASTDLIDDPAEGLMVYDESDNCINVYNDSEWINICNTSGTGGGGGSTSSASFVNCEDAGLINPKQVESAHYNGLEHAIAITSNDELWVFGRDNLNISNRSFQFPAGYSGPQSIFFPSFYNDGIAHKISTPRNNSLIPSKIIAAQNSEEAWVNTSVLPGTVYFLVEFTNGEQWWYCNNRGQNSEANALVNTSSTTSGINGTAWNAPLLCGDDLNCTSLSNTQINSMAVPISERSEKYSWVRLVTPTNSATNTPTKVVNIYGIGMTNNNGVFYLLDDGRVLHRYQNINLYSNLPTIAGHKVIQIGIIRAHSINQRNHIYFLYSNGNFYGMPFDQFSSSPTLIDTDVEELIVADGYHGGVVFYRKNDFGLHCVIGFHPLVPRLVSNTKDVAYFTSPNSYLPQRNVISYFTTNNQLKSVLDNGAIGGQGGNFANAFFPTWVVTSSATNLNVVPVLIDDLKLGNNPMYTNIPEEKINIKYTTGVKRVFLGNGTFAGIHTNEVFGINYNLNVPETHHMNDLNLRYNFGKLTSCRDPQFMFKVDDDEFDLSGTTIGQ
ncbi:MAG: hypothetical protein ACPGSD_04505 [Flavobacteriales bacterium]